MVAEGMMAARVIPETTGLMAPKKTNPQELDLLKNSNLKSSHIHNRPQNRSQNGNNENDDSSRRLFRWTASGFGFRVVCHFETRSKRAFYFLTSLELFLILLQGKSWNYLDYKIVILLEINWGIIFNTSTFYNQNVLTRIFFIFYTNILNTNIFNTKML